MLICKYVIYRQNFTSRQDGGVQQYCSQVSSQSFIESMFAVIYRKGVTWIPSYVTIFLGPQLFGPQNAVFVKPFSSNRSTPGVRRNDSEKSFTVSYLINSCRLSPEDALSVAEKVPIESPKNPDAVLELLRKYGFTNAQIARIVNKWPSILRANPEKTLLPKLEFFCSIGTPPRILAEGLSFYPFILHISLKKGIIPWYNCVKSVVRTDERVVRVFSRATRAFRSIPTRIALFREEGLPESSIASLLSRTPSTMINRDAKLSACLNRAAEMGFDKRKIVFVLAFEMFADMSESTLKRKMDVYRRCGWSETELNTAFLRHPTCMELSERKIIANMDFLVKMGVNHVAIAENPSLLGFSLEKRMKPRCLITRLLDAKGLKKMVSTISLLTMSEKMFVKRYIVGYQDYVPRLLDLYQGKLSLDEMGFSQDVINKIRFDFKQDSL